MESQLHATDGDLVRLLDNQTAATDADLQAHVAACAACSARLAHLRSLSQRVGDALRAIDVAPVDPARVRPPFDDAGIARLRRRRRAIALWSRPGLRAAAALLLLAGVAAASPAVRRWIAETVGQRREAAPTPAAEPQRSTGRSGSGAGSRVWFAAPAGPELVVRFDARPAGGTLALQVADDERASAQVVARAGGESLLILPGEVRVRNTAASVADYRLTLPSTVRVIRLYVGPAGPDPILIHVAPAMARSIDLTQSSRSR